MTPRTNGLAIASFVCAILGFLILGIPSLVGMILGFVARSQISRSQGTQKGGGLALAGIIIGALITILYIAVLVVVVTHPNCGKPHGTC
jgi:uncharacterized membrane protein